MSLHKSMSPAEKLMVDSYWRQYSGYIKDYNITKNEDVFTKRIEALNQELIRSVGLYKDREKDDPFVSAIESLQKVTDEKLKPHEQQAETQTVTAPQATKTKENHSSSSSLREVFNRLRTALPKKETSKDNKEADKTLAADSSKKEADKSLAGDSSRKEADKSLAGDSRKNEQNFVLVLGATGVGKTSLINRLSNDNKFTKSPLLKSGQKIEITQGEQQIDATTTLINMIGDVSHPGSGDLSKLHTTIISSEASLPPNIAYVLYDVTDENSFKTAQEHLEILKSNDFYKQTQIILVGNKADDVGRQTVGIEDGEKIAERHHGVTFYQYNAKINEVTYASSGQHGAKRGDGIHVINQNAYEKHRENQKRQAVSHEPAEQRKGGVLSRIMGLRS